MLKKSGLLIGTFGVLVLSACSDSVLFDKTPPPPAGPGGPGAPGAPGAPQGQGYPQQGPGQQGPYNQGPYNNGQGQYNGQGGLNGQGQIGYPQQGQGGSNGGLVGGGYTGPSPSNGSSSRGPVAGGSIQRQMSFTLNPDASISEDEIFQILFTDQAVDPFKVNQIDAKSEMKMLVKSEREGSDGTNYIKLKVILTMRMGQDSSLIREFSSDELGTVRYANSQDVLEAVMSATDKRGSYKIFVTARRGAVPAKVVNQGGRSTYDESRLWTNAWSGEMKIEKNGRKVRIGSFQGYMSSEER